MLFEQGRSGSFPLDVARIPGMKRRKRASTPTLRPLSSTSTATGNELGDTALNLSPQRTWYDNLLQLYEDQGPWNSSLGDLGMSVPGRVDSVGAGPSGLGKLNALLSDARAVVRHEESTRAKSQQQTRRTGSLVPLLAGAVDGYVLPRGRSLLCRQAPTHNSRTFIT